jgi:sulfate transport system ATP-binding protein
LRRWLRDLHKQMGLTSIFVTHDQEEALELADRVVVMDHGGIEQVGTPEEVYMKPATPFVARFVGESNRLPAGASGEIHVRPHDLEIVETETPGPDALGPVLVDNVFRKGGVWRIEGTLGASGATGGPQGAGRVVEIDLDASRTPPRLGETIRVQPRRSTTFTTNGA